MTTALVQIEITCPPWCDRSPEWHGGELWEAGGCCNHSSGKGVAADPVGLLPRPLDDLRYCDPIAVDLCATTSPDGRPQASPLLILDGRELSLPQAVALADLLVELVLKYHLETQQPTPLDGARDLLSDLLERIDTGLSALPEVQA